MVRSFSIALFLALISFGFAVSVTYAQTNELQSAIRAALMKSPNAGAVSPADIDALVRSLSSQAKAKGIIPDRIATTTLQDIQFASVRAHTICASDIPFICTVALLTGMSSSVVSSWAALILAILILAVLSTLLHRLRGLA